MEEKLIFEEIQKPAKYLYHLAIGFAVMSVVLVLITQEWFLIFLALGLFLFIRSVEMDMKIYEDKIRYKCVPFKFTYVDILFEDIESIYVGKSQGKFRYRGFKVKRAGKYEGYFFGGYDVIQIKMKNGRVIIVSTKRIDELKNIIDEAL